jgi:hypothetical protein
MGSISNASKPEEGPFMPSTDGANRFSKVSQPGKISA